MAAILMLIAVPANLPAQQYYPPPNSDMTNFKTIGTDDERVMEFMRGEISFADQQDIPTSGWEPRSVPSLWLSDEARAKQGNLLSAWLRLRFDREDIGAEPLAIYTENNREQVTVFFNGVELFRNYRDIGSQTIGWNHPYIVPLPQKLLREGSNELIVKVNSNRQFSLGIGTVKVGAHAVLGRLYSHQYFWRISSVAAANYAMLFLTIAVFLMWLRRPRETQLLWLAATGIAWFIRDLHFFVEEVVFNDFIFQQFSYYSLFFAVVFSFCFCATFLNLSYRRTIIAVMLGVGAAIFMFRLFVEQSNATDLLTALATFLVAVVFVGILAAHALKSRSAESFILLATVAATVLLGLHDIGRMPTVAWWNGIGFHIQPFTGFLLFCVFLLSLGQRFLTALDTVEGVNQVLEERVAQSTAALQKSEQARRDLAIERAVGIERERLMREMHDGIGSNLVTALAIARHQNDPSNTVASLERAITDLKLTVDSLAPVDGDVVALLANLRHRMESELEKAGLSTIWQVESCPPLPWLDATNALQLLRIVQEGVSNTLMHASASVITIGCKTMLNEGKPGILVSVKDNGCGFALSDQVVMGHGLANMKARARALSATFELKAEPGKGVQFTLWLPLSQLAFER